MGNPRSLFTGLFTSTLPKTAPQIPNDPMDIFEYSPEPTRQVNPYKDVTIIGDGPSALLMAVKLKQLGVENVTVVGPRLGEFTRSGDYVRDVFDKVSSAIFPLKIKRSKGRHIKDIERSLYDHATKLGVQFVNKKFIDFADNRHLVLSGKDNQQSLQHADIVFDCTGTKRVVLKAFNKKKNQTIFNIKKIGQDFPYNFYALVRVKLTLADVIKFLKPAMINTGLDPNPVCYALAMEDLRQLGWTSYHPPYAYANPEENHAFDDVKRKANFYMQVPPNLTREQTIKFAQIVLWLYQDNPKAARYPDIELHKESSKHAEKQVISNFEVKLAQTEPAYYNGDKNYPLILHAGDASANLPFLAGRSFYNGVERIDKSLPTFKIEKGSIKSIDLPKYQQIITSIFQVNDFYLDNQRRKLKKKMSRWKELDYVIDTYEQAEKLCQSPNDKNKISQALLKLKQGPVLDLVNKAQQLKETIDSNQFDFTKNDEYKAINYLSELSNHKSSLVQLKLETFIESFIESCRKLADEFYKRHNYACAKSYYSAILQYDTKNSFYHTKNLDIYAKLIKLESKAYPERSIALAKEIESQLGQIEISNKNSLLLDKIFYHAAASALQVAKKNKDSRPNLLNASLANAKRFIAHLSTTNNTKATELKNKIDELTAVPTPIQDFISFRPKIAVR